MTTLPMKKSIVAFVGVLLCATLWFTPAHAQTTTQQLQQQINQLLATVAALQAQLGGLTGSCTTQFTRSLGIGAGGGDVLALQRFLNQSGDTRLAASGAGSPGFETQYYGPITANAVSRFQMKYRAEILTPLGLVNPTGYFGPSSIAKANALCRVTVPPTTPPTTPPSDDEDELEGGEARLINFRADDGDDTSLSEGQNSAPVMDVEFDVEDGDVRINRIDVAFDHISGGDNRPWNVFEEVSIWVDGDEVASMDVDSRSAWSENQPNSGDYRIRITNIDDFIVREGETAEFTVAVTVARIVRDAGSVEWEMFIPNDGIRAIDSENINHFIGDTNETVQFTIHEEGADAALMVRNSSNDPDASVLPLRRNTTSDWITVFAFELDADDSADDITINSLPVTVDVSDSETYNALVRNARLVVDGQRYTRYTIDSGNTDTAVLNFEFRNNELVIDAGDAVEVSLELEFRALPEADEGTQLRAYITSAQADEIDAEGRGDLNASQIGGSASGETHTLRTGGTTFGNVVTTATLQPNSSATVDDDQGIFTIRFDVTAFEQDLFISRSASRGTTTAGVTTGVSYIIEDGSGEETTSGTANAALSSNATISGGYFRVAEGQTRTFTLTVNYDPTTQGFYQVQLYSINYNDTANNPNVFQRALPESRYETNPLHI